MMKLALIFFTLLTGFSVWFTPLQTSPSVCRGKPLPIKILTLPGQRMTGVALPLRFGGTRPFPFFPLYSDNASRLIIRNRAEFSDFWKRLSERVGPEKVPPPPDIDFSREMIVVAAMGLRPSSGYLIMIDGACEVDGHVEVFVSSLESPCGAQLAVMTAPADVVRLPQTDLPVEFHETQIDCNQWLDKLQRLSRRPENEK